MEATDVVAAVKAGDLDGHLDDIVGAVLEHVRDGNVAFLWRMQFQGDEWTQQSVTLGELKFAEQHCHITEEVGRGLTRQRKATYREINPQANAEHCLALLVAHLHKAQDVPLGEAIKQAEAVTASELDEMVGEYEVPGHPKDAGISAASTTS